MFDYESCSDSTATKADFVLTGSHFETLNFFGGVPLFSDSVCFVHEISIGNGYELLDCFIFNQKLMFLFIKDVCAAVAQEVREAGIKLSEIANYC